MTEQTIGARDTRQSIAENTLKRQVAKPKKGKDLISKNIGGCDGSTYGVRRA